MNDHTYFPRCAVCKAPYEMRVNVLTDVPVWVCPRVKRGQCPHVQVEVYRDGGWHHVPITAEIG